MDQFNTVSRARMKIIQPHPGPIEDSKNYQIENDLNTYTGTLISDKLSISDTLSCSPDKLSKQQFFLSNQPSLSLNYFKSNSNNGRNKQKLSHQKAKSFMIYTNHEQNNNNKNNDNDNDQKDDNNINKNQELQSQPNIRAKSQSNQSDNQQYRDKLKQEYLNQYDRQKEDIILENNNSYHRNKYNTQQSADFNFDNYINGGNGSGGGPSELRTYSSNLFPQQQINLPSSTTQNLNNNNNILSHQYPIHHHHKQGSSISTFSFQQLLPNQSKGLLKRSDSSSNYSPPPRFGFKEQDEYESDLLQLQNDDDPAEYFYSAPYPTQKLSEDDIINHTDNNNNNQKQNSNNKNNNINDNTINFQNSKDQSLMYTNQSLIGRNNHLHQNYYGNNTSQNNNRFQLNLYQADNNIMGMNSEDYQNQINITENNNNKNNNNIINNNKSSGELNIDETSNILTTNNHFITHQDSDQYQNTDAHFLKTEQSPTKKLFEGRIKQISQLQFNEQSNIFEDKIEDHINQFDQEQQNQSIQTKQSKQSKQEEQEQQLQLNQKSTLSPNPLNIKLPFSNFINMKQTNFSKSLQSNTPIKQNQFNYLRRNSSCKSSQIYSGISGYGNNNNNNNNNIIGDSEIYIPKLKSSIYNNNSVSQQRDDQSNLQLMNMQSNQNQIQQQEDLQDIANRKEKSLSMVKNVIQAIQKSRQKHIERAKADKQEKIMKRVKEFIKILKMRSNLRSPSLIKKKMLEIINDLVYTNNKSNIFRSSQKQVSMRVSRLILKIQQPTQNWLVLIINKINKLPLFHPQSFFKLTWDFIHIVIILFIFFYIPIQMVTGENMGKLNKAEYQWGNAILMIFLFFIFDIIISFNTGIYDQGIVNENRKDIAIIYMKGQMILDIIYTISIMKTNYNNDIEEQQLFSIICGFLLFLKIFTLRRIINNFTDILLSIRNNTKLYYFIELLTLLVTILFVGHIFACAFWNVAESNNDNLSTKTWMRKVGVQDDEWQTKYLYSIYFSITTMITVGYGDITPQNNSEIIMGIVCMILSSAVFGYSLNTIGVIIKEIQKDGHYIKEQMSLVNRYLNSKNIGYDLKVSIRMFLQYKLKTKNIISLEQEKYILEELSTHLREKLISEENINIMKLCKSTFSSFSEECLQKLALRMKQFRVSKNEMIFEEGQYEDDPIFYFIQRGTVELFVESVKGDYNFTTLEILTEGNSLGETSIYIDQFQAVFSAKALEMSILRTLSRSDILDVLRHFPKDYEKFCYFRDEIIFNKQTNKIHQNCFNCLSSNHTISHCPSLNYVPDKEKIILTYIYSEDQKRYHQKRKMKKKINAKMNQNEIEEIQKLYLSKQKEEVMLLTWGSEDEQQYNQLTQNEIEESIMNQTHRISNNTMNNTHRIINQNKNDNQQYNNTSALSHRQKLSYHNLFNKSRQNQNKSGFSKEKYGIQNGREGEISRRSKNNDGDISSSSSTPSSHSSHSSSFLSNSFIIMGKPKKSMNRKSSYHQSNQQYSSQQQQQQQSSFLPQQQLMSQQQGQQSQEKAIFQTPPLQPLNFKDNNSVSSNNTQFTYTNIAPQRGMGLFRTAETFIDNPAITEEDLEDNQNNNNNININNLQDESDNVNDQLCDERIIPNNNNSLQIRRVQSTITQNNKNGQQMHYSINTPLASIPNESTHNTHNHNQSTIPYVMPNIDRPNNFNQINPTKPNNTNCNAKPPPVPALSSIRNNQRKSSINNNPLNQNKNINIIDNLNIVQNNLLDVPKNIPLRKESADLKSNASLSNRSKSGGHTNGNGGDNDNPTNRTSLTNNNNNQQNINNSQLPLHTGFTFNNTNNSNMNTSIAASNINNTAVFNIQESGISNIKQQKIHFDRNQDIPFYNTNEITEESSTMSKYSIPNFQKVNSARRSTKSMFKRQSHNQQQQQQQQQFQLSSFANNQNNNNNNMYSSEENQQITKQIKLLISLLQERTPDKNNNNNNQPQQIEGLFNRMISNSPIPRKNTSITQPQSNQSQQHSKQSNFSQFYQNYINQTNNNNNQNIQNISPLLPPLLQNQISQQSQLIPKEQPLQLDQPAYTLNNIQPQQYMKRRKNIDDVLLNYIMQQNDNTATTPQIPNIPMKLHSSINIKDYKALNNLASIHASANLQNGNGTPVNNKQAQKNMVVQRQKDLQFSQKFAKFQTQTKNITNNNDNNNNHNNNINNINIVNQSDLKFTLEELIEKEVLQDQPKEFTYYYPHHNLSQVIDSLKTLKVNLCHAFGKYTIYNHKNYHIFPYKSQNVNNQNEHLKFIDHHLNY